MTSPPRSFGSQPAAISLRSSSPHEPRTFSAVCVSTSGGGTSAGHSHLSHPSEGRAPNIFSEGFSMSAPRSLIVTFNASSQGLPLIKGSSPCRAIFLYPYSGEGAKGAKGCREGLSHLSHLSYLGYTENSRVPSQGRMQPYPGGRTPAGPNLFGA